MNRLADLAKRRFRVMWSLLLSAGTMYSLVLLFRWKDFDPGPTSNFDTWMVTAMGLAYAGTVIEMLIRNEQWPLRAHGQIWTYIGDALLWCGVGFFRLGWRHQLTTDDLYKIRAAFIVGVAGLALGIIWFEFLAFMDWRYSRGLAASEDRDDVLVSTVAVERRQNHEDRRKGWGRLPQ